MEEIEAKGEEALGSIQWGVTGNHKKVKYGGQHIRDSVKEEDKLYSITLQLEGRGHGSKGEMKISGVALILPFLHETSYHL